MKLQDMMSQNIRIRRLIKRNRRTERSIRKRLNAQGMDATFENQKCQIPFILVKMMQHPNYQIVEHDGRSQVKLHSGAPIKCQGDAEIISQIYPNILGCPSSSSLNQQQQQQQSSQTVDFTRDFARLRQHIPFDEFQRFQKVLKKASRKYNEVQQRAEIDAGN